MNKNWYLLIFLISFSCNTIKKTSYNPSKKFSSADLKHDFAILDKTLKGSHPSLYWYTPQDSVNNFFRSAYASLNDSMTEVEFRKKVSWVINKIHCGHTVVRSSKNYSKYYSKHQVKSFPLLLKVWDDSAVVMLNFLKEDSMLQRGTIITKINGVPVKEITDSMCSLISSDGYSNIFKYQLISFNFPAFYKYTYGLDSNYLVEYIDTTGKRNTKLTKNFESKAGTINNNQLQASAIVTRKQFRQLKLQGDRSLAIDSSTNTAVMSVNTFAKGKLIRFFHRSFKELYQKSVANLVIDLRLNSGGSVIACTRLSQYLINKSFHVSDTVAAYNRSFPNKKYIKPWLIYWLSMHISGRRMQDERIHFRYFEKHYFKPKSKNHFNGNIYLLTGGYTFSAATLVASNLKGQPNVTIVGEETGGAAYGNSAMLLTTIVLPKTGLRVTLPLFRMVLNAARLKNGYGVMPDVEVKPSSEFIKAGIDAKFEKAMELIRQKKDEK